MPESNWIEHFFESGSIMSLGDKKVLLGAGERVWRHRPHDYTKTPNFYFPDFFLEQSSPWFTQKEWGEYSLESLQNFFANYAPKHTRHNWKSSGKESFRDTFESLQRLFSEKILDKAVPYVFEGSSCKMSRDQLILSLISIFNYAQNNPVFIYGFWDQNQGVLGATPELLFRFSEDDVLETVALAATCSGKDHKQTFFTDPKQLHEHQIVIDGIKQSLAPFGSFHAGKHELLELKSLTHILTRIYVKLNQASDFESIVKSLHPTPALGAFPREHGNKWLREYNEKYNRGRYGAPTGLLYQNLQSSCCYVAIRNVQWDVNKIYLGAGCGVVTESLFEREWEEISLKIDAIKEMLNL